MWRDGLIEEKWKIADEVKMNANEESDTEITSKEQDDSEEKMGGFGYA